MPSARETFKMFWKEGFPSALKDLYTCWVYRRGWLSGDCEQPVAHDAVRALGGYAGGPGQELLHRALFEGKREEGLGAALETTLEVACRILGFVMYMNRRFRRLLVFVRGLASGGEQLRSDCHNGKQFPKHVQNYDK